MFQQWVYFRWCIPGTDRTIWEGTIDQTLISLCQITAVFVALTFVAVAWQRYSDRIDLERRRDNED